MAAQILKKTSSVFIIGKNSISVVKKVPINIFVISNKGSKLIQLNHSQYSQYKLHRANDSAFKAADLLSATPSI